MPGIGIGGFFGSGAAAFTPASLTDLVLWLTAGPTWCFSDAGGTVPCAVDDPVRVWKDRSGNGLDLSQATAGSRPLLKLVSGKYCVRFDGTDDVLTRAYSTGTITNLTYGAAFNAAAVGFGIFVTARSANSEWRINGTPVLNFTTDDGVGNVVGTTTLSLATNYRGVVTSQGGSVVIYLNGVSDATGSDTSTFAPTDLSVGGRFSGSVAFNGDIYGAVYCSAGQTAAPNVALLDTYLASLQP